MGKNAPKPAFTINRLRSFRCAIGVKAWMRKSGHPAMDQSDLETCPRCGGTGVDPDPDEGYRQSPTADGLVGTLVALFLDWIMRKTLAVLFPKFHARCRYCRGAGRVPQTQ